MRLDVPGRWSALRHALARRRAARVRRTWPQRLVLASGVLISLATAAAAIVVQQLYAKVEQIPRVELGHVLADPVSTSQPRNVLLVGTDEADGLDEGSGVLRGRDSGPPLADTIMLLRLDPQDQQAALLSFPRDLWVTFPDTGARSRINTAIWRGDGRPDVLIDLFDDYFDIPVHNYVQVGMGGFVDLVDLLDGVPIHFDAPGRDRRSGLHVYDAGCVMLEADEALAYVRSRHYEEYNEDDEDWRAEGRSDLARVERQQDFIQRVVDRAVSRGARNPGTLNGLVDAGISNLTVDDELSVGDVVNLGREFQSFEPDALQTYTLPVDEGRVGGADVVHMDEQEAESVLELFRDVPLPEELDGASSSGSSGVTAEGDMSPYDVRLTVLNGSGRPGEASTAGAELDTAGFAVVGRDNAVQFGLDRTEVRYSAESEEEAATVERWLVAGAELVESSEVVGVTVVTGEDWSGVRSSPRVAADNKPTPADDVSDADASEADTTTTGSDTSSSDTSSSDTEASSDGTDDDRDADDDGDSDGDSDDDRNDESRSRVAC